MVTHNWEAIEKDREDKKRLVIDKIASHCNSSSPHGVLRHIGIALDSGDVLVAEISSGGLTNFSYKVYLSNSPDTALFTKLSFPFALWNPDPEEFYDVKRTVNEYEMMQKFSNMAEDCVAEPLICEAIDEMMILVTEWCSGRDEQWANQIIDGQVDPRLASKLTESIAKLHSCKDFDPDFNTNVRPCIASVFSTQHDAICSLIDSSDTNSRAHRVAKETGKAASRKIVDRCIDNLENDRDCLIHNDLHYFNLLVENKPSAESLEHFGPNGSISVCDWEMSIAGPIGKDIGTLHAFPIACAVAHALNRNRDAAFHLLDFLDTVWDEYAMSLKKEGNKIENDLFKIYRNVIGWAGSFIFCAYHILGVHLELLPLDEDDVAGQEFAKDSVAALGIKLLSLGFEQMDPASCLDELRDSYRKAVEEELDAALSMKRPRKQRRLSALRSSGLRISDAALHCSSRSIVTPAEISEDEPQQ